MGQRGESLVINDFSGGLNTENEYQCDLKSSPDCQNITLVNGGFRKRYGDTAFNASAMISTSTAITGAGHIQYSSGTEFINAVAGSKFFTSSSLTGTMADATGLVTITAGTNNLWTPVRFNDLQVWFGGAPDAPFKYSGSGNATLLAGTPPSSYTAFVANNRVFAVGTATYKSRIFWCVLSNPDDWTSSGSGNADVGLNDGEPLLNGVVLSADSAILFKNLATHLMRINRAPFPIYQLQSGIGACGRYSIVNAKGVIYFMTPAKRIKATTNGVNFDDLPTTINSILDDISSDYLPYVKGVYYQAEEQVRWYVPKGALQTTNNYCIIWDLKNKCWLVDSGGQKCNVVFMSRNRDLYAGHYDGTIYKKNVSGVYTDASEASPSAIDSYWRTPFKGKDNASETVHPLWIDIIAKQQASSNVDVSYGYDFVIPQRTENVSLESSGDKWDVDNWDEGLWSGEGSTIKRMIAYGRGNVMSIKVRNGTASQSYEVRGIHIPFRTDKSRKELSQT